MSVFITSGSKLYIGPPQAGDPTLAQYQALITGSFAAGDIVFSAQPADSGTITLEGTVVTFSTAPTTGHVTIGTDLPTTLQNLLAFLEASVDANIIQMTYTVDEDTLYCTAAVGGTGGNALTLAASTSPASHGTVSAGTLAGGGGTAWVPIGEIESLGDFGDTSAPVTFMSIADGRVRKLKGARDAGNMALVCGFDARDPGQVALKSAQTTSFYFAFQMIASDKRLPSDIPTYFYFTALVESAKTNFGANNNVPKTTFTLGINTAIDEVESAAA